MLVLRQIKEIEEIITLQKQKGCTIGFVPTMGALHNGHISLIAYSKQQTGFTVCSVFVNPNQFNNQSDLAHYPRTPDADMALLEAAGCDVLYMPEVNDVYPEKDTRVFNFGYLDTILEGAHRPGHFNGVGQVVSILLEGVKPDKAFFGSKDYQQVMVVRELVRQLQLPVEIVACPILREPDGLAMSSRNTRLSAGERKTAALVPEIMQGARLVALNQGIAAAKAYVAKRVSDVDAMRLDYYEICDAETLKPLSSLSENTEAISLMALFVGNIRLIDNWMI